MVGQIFLSFGRFCHTTWVTLLYSAATSSVNKIPDSYIFISLWNSPEISEMAAKGEEIISTEPSVLIFCYRTSGTARLNTASAVI